MFQLFFLLAVCLPYGLAAPQGSPLCNNVPVNPYAAQIGAEFLQIPGCDTHSVVPVQSLGPSPSNPASPSISTPTSLPSPPPSGFSTLSQNPPSAAAPPPSTTQSPSNLSTSSSSSADIGTPFKSSITRYGQGPPGTPGTDHHCQHNEGACENNPQSGYTAAASQFLFFHGTPAAPGSACGTCWRVSGPATDGSGKPLPTNDIVVLITNECAAQDPGQPVNLCGMASLQDQNPLGANVNIDLCMDSGASQGFFGDPPWGTALGGAQQVGCQEWCGVWSNGTKSGPQGCQAPPAPWPVTT